MCFEGSRKWETQKDPEAWWRGGVYCAYPMFPTAHLESSLSSKATFSIFLSLWPSSDAQRKVSFGQGMVDGSQNSQPQEVYQAVPTSSCFYEEGNNSLQVHLQPKALNSCILAQQETGDRGTNHIKTHPISHDLFYHILSPKVLIRPPLIIGHICLSKKGDITCGHHCHNTLLAERHRPSEGKAFDSHEK